MNWTLLVPGALLPAALAPQIAGAMAAPRLAQSLAGARKPSAPAVPGAQRGAPHWSWLAAQFGMDPVAPVTAPYACGGPPAPMAPAWVAHCDPVHLAIARDHIVLTCLDRAPLQAHEAQALLALANDLAQPSGLQLQIHDDRWFAVAEQPWQLDTVPLDAVLGRSVQEHLPRGAHGRRWRALSNEIQMAWHASAVSAAREERDQPGANALWLHGGGPWSPLVPSRFGPVQVAPGTLEARVLQGWMRAGAISGRADADTLSVYRGLFDAHAHQAWESWLGGVAALEDRIQSDLAAARGAGAQHFYLVACGAEQSRTIELALHRPWWQWPRRIRRPAATLASWLAEAEEAP